MQMAILSEEQVDFYKKYDVKIGVYDLGIKKYNFIPLVELKEECKKKDLKVKYKGLMKDPLDKMMNIYALS